jgi:signal transduction histidine kinase
MAGEITRRKLSEKELQRAKAKVEAASTAKSAFLANMSHEVRTPLNGIQGVLELIEASNLDAEQREYVEVALQSSKRLTKLLTDIVDFSRVEADKVELVSELFDLTHTVDSVARLFKPLALRKGVSLAISLDPSLPKHVRGDSVRLEQVLINLVGNAVKFTDAGSIEIGVAPVPGPSKDVARMRFTVSDTGIGIPPEKAHTIFEAFSQVESNFGRRYQGAGLGLAISQQLVSLMGGDLEFESEPGQGTTFRFDLQFPHHHATV